MVPIQMELGGKDAAIVCSDADIDAAAKHIIKGGFSYSGQRCTGVEGGGGRPGAGAALPCSERCSGARPASVCVSPPCPQPSPAHVPAPPANPCPNEPRAPASLPSPLPPALHAPPAVKLVLVMEDVADALVEKVVAGVRKLSVGM